MGEQSPERLRRTLAQLSEEHQHVLALRYGCGLTTAAVARTLRTTEAAAHGLEAQAIAAVAAALIPGR